MKLHYAIPHVLLFIILLVLLLLVMLLLPIQYRLRGQLEEDCQLDFSIGCGFLYQMAAVIERENRFFIFRLLGIRLPIKNRPKSLEWPETKEKYRKKSKLSRRDLRLVLNRELFQGALNLLGRSFRHLKPSRIYLQGCYGFEEPHFTAWMLPLIGVVSGWDSAVQIDLLPIWDQAYVDIDLDIQGRIVPGILLLFLLRLLLSKPVRRIIKAKWKSKNIKKRFRMQPNLHIEGK